MAVLILSHGFARTALAQLDERWTMTAAGQSVTANPDGTFSIDNISAPDFFGPEGPGQSGQDFLSDDFVRVTGVGVVDGITYYAFSECFRIAQGETYVVEELSFADAPLVSVESISAAAETGTLTRVGETTQIVITATLSDGTMEIADSTVVCLAFRTSNSGIVSVDENGVATAIGDGTAYITAVGVAGAAVTAVTVSLGDPLTTVVGFVQLEDGTFVQDALVNLVGLIDSGTTGPDGSFLISGVATLQGSIIAAAEAEVDGETLLGATLTPVEPVAGGFTDLGIIVLNNTNIWISDNDGSWHDDSNWIFGAAPLSGQKVVINRPGVELTVTYSSGTSEIVSLTSEESLVVLGGSLSLSAASTFNNSVVVSGGTLSLFATTTINGSLSLPISGVLTGSGDLTVSGLTSWAGGTLSGSGTLFPDGGMSIDELSAKTLDQRTIDNSGVTSWLGGSVIVGSNGAVFNNLPGATFDMQFDASLSQGAGTPLHFNNEGLFTKSGGTGTGALHATFDNTGQFEVMTGTMNLTKGGSHTGTFSGPGTIQFGGGTHDLLPGSTLTGSVWVSGGTTNIDGTYAGVDTLVSLGVLNFNVGSTTETLTVSISGVLTGSGDLTVSGPTSWIGGTLSGSGTLFPDGGMSIDELSAKTLDQRTIDNSGVTSWLGGSGITGSNGAVFNNLPGATFDMQFDASLSQGAGTPLHFNNEGLFTKSGGTGTGALHATFDNSGTVAAQTGILSFNRGLIQTAGGTQLDGGSISISSGFVFDLDGGDLTGDGSLIGTLLSDAVVSPGFSAGALSISDDYAQGTFGELNIEIGGLLAGDEFDVLTVSDQATLSGTLNINLIDDFTPELGDTFQIMNYAARTGTFDTVTGLDIGRGLVFELTYGPTRVTLTVVAR